jgi:hypothetical protein
MEASWEGCAEQQVGAVVAKAVLLQAKLAVIGHLQQSQSCVLCICMSKRGQGSQV